MSLCDALRAALGHAPRGLPHLAKEAMLTKAGGPGQARWLTFGDSMAALKRIELDKYMQRLFGSPMLLVGPGLTFCSTGGAITTNTTDYASWVTGESYTLEAGSHITCNLGGGRPLCTTVKMYYIKTPGAGSFTISVNGAAEADYTNISAAGTGELGIVSITKPQGEYDITVTVCDAPVKVLFFGFMDTAKSSYTVINVGRGGLRLLDGWTPQAKANFEAFLADVQPTVLTYEMREVDSAGDRAAVRDFFASCYKASPATDYIGFAAPPEVNDGTPFDNRVEAQNSHLREAVEAIGGIYYDSWSPVSPYAKLDAIGWAGDGIHPAQGLQKYMLPMMLRDLGMIGIGDLPLPFSISGETAQLTKHLEVTREADAGSRWAARVQADPDFGYDTDLLLWRWLSVWNRDKTTEVMRLWPDDASYGWFPRFLRLGEGNAMLQGDSDTRMHVRKGSGGDLRGAFGASHFSTSIESSSASGEVVVSFAGAAVQIVTLTGDATSLAFDLDGTEAGDYLELHLVQDGTGGRTIAGISGSIKLSDGGITLSTAPHARDVIRLRRLAGGDVIEIGRATNVCAAGPGRGWE